MALPAEARAGVMRAWIKVLSDRHPEITWIPADPNNNKPSTEHADELANPAQLANSA
jgi:hypothetical protein